MFNVGDKVRIIDGYNHYLDVGSIGVIVRGAVDGLFDVDGYSTDFGGDLPQLIKAYQMQLVEEDTVSKFNVGDKVRIGEHTSYPRKLNGLIGTVTRVTGEGLFMVASHEGLVEHNCDLTVGKITFHLSFYEKELERVDQPLVTPAYFEESMFNVNKMYDEAILAGLSDEGVYLTFGGKRYRLTLTEVEEDVYTEEDAYYDGTYDQDGEYR
jgi:hypothetical protein